MKKFKKFAALALSASMVMGMTLTSMAAEPEVSVDAPIYAYDITNVVVPTSFVVAFNPSGLDVTKNGSTVNDQIVSKNYGIINKSTKDKIITVTLKVEDLNEDKIEFVANPADVTSAAADNYVVNLTLIPASDTSDPDKAIKVGATPKTADLTTTGADLANVQMDSAAGSAQVLVAGENDVDFLLEKAVYSGSIDLDNAKDNNVVGAFDIDSLAADDKGITAFTFGGTMNAKADWTKLTKGIRITAIYSNMNAPADAAPETGTGALYNNPNPVFKTGSEVGTIKYKKGTGSDAVDTITSITMLYKGGPNDGYNAVKGAWEAADDSNGMITFDSSYMKYFIGSYVDETTIEATITYTTVGGDSKTTTVDVRLRKPVITTPSFTMGSEVGTINYVTGTGNDALASITSIEMDYKGSPNDGYNAVSGAWAAATDENGKITFDSKYMTYFIAQNPSDTTRIATITYVTVGGDTKTTTVDVKLR